MRHAPEPDCAVNDEFAAENEGGGAADVAGAFDRRGLGAVINNSRGIITAWKKTPDGVRDHAKAARQAALAMKEDILSYLGSIAL